MVGDKRGIKPWQSRGPAKPDATNGAAPKESAANEVDAEAATIATSVAEALSGKDSQKLADDVLEAAHERKGEARTESVSARNFARALASGDAFSISGGSLSLGNAASGAKTFSLSAKQQAALTTLPSTKLAIASLWGALQGGRATLLSASPGAGASFATRWTLDAIRAKHEVARLTRTTTLDQLVGAMRPDDSKKLRVKDGPLTDMIRNGGVFVAESIENADPQIIACLTSLARGAKIFHHPVSNEAIKVSPDFRLVLVADPSKRLPPQLPLACDVVEIPPYGKDDHVRLLVERHGLSRALADKIATLHEDIVDATSKGDLDFGRRFPLAWSQLDRVARRVAKNDDLAGAVNDIYGARLTAPTQRAAFAKLCVDAGIELPSTAPTSKAKSAGYVVTKHLEAPLAQTMTALKAGETVLLQGPGQSGASRMVDEIGARLGQEVVTVIAHPGTDPQALIELPVFDDDGRVYFKPGRISKALAEGKLVYIDHLDFLPVERQNAFFRLLEMGTVPVLENGAIVQRAVHKDARVILSATTGPEAARARPDPADRARATEVHIPPAAVDDAAKLLPSTLPADVKAAAVEAANAMWPSGSPVKLQRFLDFANATNVIAKAYGGNVARAVEKSAHMLFDVPSDVAQMLASNVRKSAAKKASVDDKPLWQTLLGLSESDVKKRLANTEYRLVPSLERHLDALATAYVLQRPVLAVGPAAAGKTVLGSLFSALVDKKVARSNFSASTEVRDVFGGVGPVNEDGRTKFREVRGPFLEAPLVQKNILADEWNLSKEARIALKPMLDYRHTGIDAERDVEQELGTTFFYAAQNPTDVKSGRVPIEPTILDCMFVIDVEAKPVEEKVEIVKGHTSLPVDEITRIASFFADLEIAKKKLKSAVSPITTTERDILKAAKAAEYFIARDKITDAKERRAIIARETWRVIADVLVDPKERELVWKSLAQKAFDLKDVSMPTAPTKIERIVVDGKACLQIGAARIPLRALGKNKKLDALIPSTKGLKEPIGPQIAVLESVLLGLETKQPTAIVGMTGTGKTMLMRWIAHELNWPVFEQAFHEDMTKDDILGAPVLTKERTVEFKMSPLDEAVLEGGIFIGDEYLTLPNETRESTNPITEGSELQIPSRPPRTVTRDQWHENFRFVVTTNGGDIRKADFSMAEASRMRVIAIAELSEQTDLEAIAQRDFASPLSDSAVMPSLDGDKPADVSDASVKRAIASAKKALTAEKLTAAYLAIRSGADPKAFADDELAVATLISALPDVDKARIISTVSRPTNVLRDACVLRPVVDGRLTSAKEVSDAVEMFCRLRDVQRARGSEVSPLTQRVFTSFLEILASLRETNSFPAAAMRAAELTLLSKMGRGSEKAALDLIAKIVGDDKRAEDASVPVLQHASSGDVVKFGDTEMRVGALAPKTPDNRRFPLTSARCHNLGLLADAVELGRGRPISCTDDENGETVETIRELGRLTGRQVTVVTLSKNVDVDALIERLSLSKDAEALGTFEPELQQIGRAVVDGHLLVLKGCGNVPSTKLERLNSLGDGRQSITLPRTGETVDAHADFRMIMLKKPSAPFGYSPALENRLIEPMLTTRSSSTSTLDKKTAELAGVVRERTGIDTELAIKLAAFHTYLNEVLRQGAFASGRQIVSFLNRDAEAVAQRLAWLTARGLNVDDVEALHDLVMQVYGQRFTAESDRLLLNKLAQRAFGSDGGKLDSGGDAVRTPNLVRFGPWMLPADPRGVRDGVPGRDDVLPPTAALEDVEQKMIAALQFDEVVHLHGDGFVASAVTAGVARLTTSRVVEVDGNEELSEQYLFGGLVQNSKTGKFEMQPGVLERAQKDGATVVLKNASRIPEDVLLPLAEIAATGQMSKIVDGKVEHHPTNFRLILQTNEGDPPLLADLAQVATRVACQNVGDDKSLSTILAHVLVGVPGGAEIADALVELTKRCARVLEGETLTGRQPLRYDSGRAVEAARQLKRIVMSARDAGSDVPLESAIADVVQRLYARPAHGLKGEARIAELVESVGAKLAEPGALEAQQPPAIDDVENPAVALLLKDYSEHAPELTASTMHALAEGLRTAISSNASSSNAVLTAKDIARVVQLCATIADSKVVPEAVRERANKIAQKGDVATERDLSTLITLVEKQAAPEQSFHDTALELMRGARLWDVEHREKLLGRYRELFDAVDAFARANGNKGNDLAARAYKKDLDSVRERFDATDAIAKVTASRTAVTEAFDKYQQRAGERDDQLAGLFKRLLESWDFVATSPIFVKHHVLRQELGAMSQILQQIVDAHEKRGEAVSDVKALVDEVKHAGTVLEGVRIAEQSTDLRRDLLRSSKATEQIIEGMRGELVTMRELENAEREHDRLMRALTTTRSLRAGSLLESGEIDVAARAPDAKSDDQLRADAIERAKVELAPKLDELRMAELAAAQANDAANKPRLAGFFDDYDVDAVFAADPAESKLGARGDLSKLDARVAAKFDALVQRRADALFVQLKDAEQKRATKEMQGKIELDAKRTAGRITGSATDAALDLNRIASTLDLDSVDPKLAAEVNDARAALQQLARQATNWVQDVMNAAAEVATSFVSSMVSMMTFGLLGGARKSRVDVKPPQLDTSAVEEQVARVVAKLEKHIEAENAKLPDFSKRSVHAATRDRLAEQLINADTYGELASKIARITRATNDEADVDLKRTLSSIVNRTAGSNIRVLLKIAELAESANTLSSELARDYGVSSTVAPVLEAVMHAAESFGSLPVGAGSLAQPIKSLQSAVRSVDNLGQSAHPLLLAVRGEMEELLALLGAGATAVKIDGAGIGVMLEGLAETVASTRADRGLDSRADSVDGARGSNGANDVDGASDADDVDGALERQLRKILVPGVNESEGVERVTELKIIDVNAKPGLDAIEDVLSEIESGAGAGAVGGAKGATGATGATGAKGAKGAKGVDVEAGAKKGGKPSAVEAGEKSSKPEESKAPVAPQSKSAEGTLDDTMQAERAARQERVKQLESIARGVVEKAEDQIKALPRQRDEIAKALSKLEDGVKSAACAHWAAQLDAVKALVEEIASHGGTPYRKCASDVGRALSLLRKTHDALASLDGAPPEVATALADVIESARDLASAKSSFDENAFAWARSSLTVLRDAKSKLDEAGGAQASKDGQLGALDDVKQAIAKLDQHEGRLGAASAASVLRACDDRLLALAPALPESARKDALALAEAARKKAAALDDKTGGPNGERSVADLVEGFTDLCAVLAKNGKLQDDHIDAASELADVINSLLAKPGTRDDDLALCARGVSAAKSVRDAKGAKEASVELDDGFAALRTALLTQALGAIASKHRATTEAWGATVRDVHAQLRSVVDAFVHYDPLDAATKKTQAQLAHDVKDAVAAASEQLTGPAAVLMARTLVELRRSIESTTEGKAEGDQLLRELDPFLRLADGIIEDCPDADLRFAKILAAVDDKLAKAASAGQRRKALAGLDEIVEATASLLSMVPHELPAKLADVERCVLGASEANNDDGEHKVRPETRVESAVERELKKVQRDSTAGPVVAAGSGGRGVGLGGVPVASVDGANGANGANSRRAGIVDGGGARGGVEPGRVVDLVNVAIGAPQKSVGLGGFAGFGDVGGGDGTADAPAGDKELVDVQGEAPLTAGKAATKDGRVDEIKRQALGATAATSRTDKVEVVYLSNKDVKDAQKDAQRGMDEEIAAEKMRIMGEKPGEKLLNEYQQFVLDNDELVDEMAMALRAVPNTEIAVVIDQSGSTSATVGDSRIIDQERAALALVLAAVQRSESNCAVVGFGAQGIGKGRAANYGGVYSYVHKGMDERLDDDNANEAFIAAGRCDGGTDFVGPISVAAGQFSQKANNKMILFLTDGALNDAGNVRRYIDKLRDADAQNGRPPTGVAFMGFGDASQIEYVAGRENSVYVRSYPQAAKMAAALMRRCLVQNTSGIGGKLESSASGIGVATQNAQLEAATPDGLGEVAQSLTKPFVPGDDPAVVYGSEGERRAMSNLVSKPVYDAALKQLERSQKKSSSSPDYRKALQIVREMSTRHERDGTLASLTSGISSTLPKTGGSQWVHKQTSGTGLDENELPMYLMGIEQGVPVTKIFKKRKQTEEGKATVVLCLDESTSMNTEKQRAALEALFVYGDALKQIDPDIEIAVLGFGDKVRLHAGFEQTWGDELKASILMQAQNVDEATDDERAGVEAIGLLKMIGADVGQIVSFSDGQGMPGVKQVMRQAEQDGYGFLTVGVGPESKSVLRFKDNGLYARNLNALALQLPQAAVKMWERAGRIVSG